MSAVARVAAFAAVVVVVFAAAFGIGRLTGSDEESSAPEADGHGSHGSHGGADAGDAGDRPESADYALEIADDVFEPGMRELAFTVTSDGEPVTDFEVVHEKRLHLIAVREDFVGYQHVHPELADDGTWTTELRLQPGSWRLYADFRAEGGEPTVLDARLHVDGEGAPEEPRPETRVATVDGYRVELRGDLVAGGDSVLAPRVTRGGEDVTDQLEPYLGALGHLVALRHGDLAYLHVHPEGLDFHTEVPSKDTYELFLDFKVDGVVRTARFTLDAGSGEPESEGHHEH